AAVAAPGTGLPREAGRWRVASRSSEQQQRETPPLRRDPRILKPDRLEDLQQLGLGRTFVPFGIALDHRQKRFGRIIALPCCNGSLSEGEQIGRASCRERV